MNRERRKKLQDAAKRIGHIVELIEEIRDEEQDAHDNLPESMIDGERGERMEEAIDHLEDAIADLESAVENIESAAE